MRNPCPRGLAVFLLLAAGAGAQEITEKELVRRFLSESPHVRELSAGIAALRAETRGWSLWPNPAASYSREGAGLTQFLQYEQALPVSGRLSRLQRAGSEFVGAAQSQTEFTRWELISEIRTAFYDLVTAQERETAVRANLDRLDEILKILRAREQEGEGSAYDRLRTERERSEIETEIAAVRIGTAQARSRLAAFLPRGSVPESVNAKGSLASSQPIPTLEALLARALDARGDYKAERQEIAGLEYRRQAAERLRIPEPSVAVGYKRADIGPGATPGSTIAGNGSFVALSVPLPLFNKGKTEVARYRAETERVQARRQSTEQRIVAEVDAARKILELRRGVLSDYQRRVEEQGRQLEQIARGAYQEGEIGILELLDAYRVNLQSRLRSLEFTSAAKQAEIDLERVIGAPVLNQEVLP